MNEDIIMESQFWQDVHSVSVVQLITNHDTVIPYLVSLHGYFLLFNLEGVVAVVLTRRRFFAGFFYQVYNIYTKFASIKHSDNLIFIQVQTFIGISFVTHFYNVL